MHMCPTHAYPLPAQSTCAACSCAEQRSPAQRMLPAPAPTPTTACYFGLGYGVGALAGGFLSHKLGFQLMYLCGAGAMFCCGALLQVGAGGWPAANGPLAPLQPSKGRLLRLSHAGSRAGSLSGALAAQGPALGRRECRPC